MLFLQVYFAALLSFMDGNVYLLITSKQSNLAIWAIGQSQVIRPCWPLGQSHRELTLSGNTRQGDRPDSSNWRKFVLPKAVEACPQGVGLIRGQASVAKFSWAGPRQSKYSFTYIIFFLLYHHGWFVYFEIRLNLPTFTSRYKALQIKVGPNVVKFTGVTFVLALWPLCGMVPMSWSVTRDERLTSRRRHDVVTIPHVLWNMLIFSKLGIFWDKKSQINQYTQARR